MNSGPSNQAAGGRRALLICLGLVAATVAVYWPVGGFDFVNLDDRSIFFDNAFVCNGLAWPSIVWGATTCFYEYWHPLMWWSHMLDCQLFGLNAGAHHLVSLGFQVANTLLVFAIFRRMTGRQWRSAIVAALFGVHPLHVESVAWLAERKDLLSTFFWLLSVWAYVLYTQKSKARSSKSKAYYGLSLLFFLLGLLSKPMVVTLPFALVLLDYWPLNRISDLKLRISDWSKKGRKDTLAWRIREKWPFFGLTVLFCFITWYSVKLGGNLPQKNLASPWMRLSNIPVAYVRYLWKTLYPRNLAVLYPMPEHLPWWQVAGAVVILVVISWMVLRAVTMRYLAFGWFFFLGILVPTIGIVQVGEQAMADRYMYVPLIGLAAAFVWGAADFFARWRIGAGAAGSLAIIYLCLLGWLARVQVESWRNSVSLWTQCLAAGAVSATAYHDLGHALVALGETDKAMEQFKAALRIAPNDQFTKLTYGGALIAAGKPAEATNYLAQVLAEDPNYAEAHENMGQALLDLGDFNGAIEQFSDAMRLTPGSTALCTSMGRAYSGQNKPDEAYYWYREALKLNPSEAAPYYYMGMEDIRRGAYDEAVSNLNNSVKFDPTLMAPHFPLAQIYTRNHDVAKAIAEYHAALRINPNLPQTLNNLAWLLATTPDTQFRNGAEAVKLAQQACELSNWNQTLFIGTLAAAYAEAGDFDKAVETAQKACDLATAHGEKELLQANQNLLAQYKQKQPFREQGVSTNTN